MGHNHHELLVCDRCFLLFTLSMGVNSFWNIVGPCARPVRLEALSRKKLAVDASIWIYQFLKAVRDSEGNALPQYHIVGFFRRICKLLYYGILPVFVFDGGAPTLKRETIQKRREKREGSKESTAETAQRILAVQVRREADKGKDKKTFVEDEGDIVYLEDLVNPQPKETIQSNSDNSKQNTFYKKDEYHLPELKRLMASTDDSRIMPEDEIDRLTKSTFEKLGDVDIESIDPRSKEFDELPLEAQYMIITHLRLRSRLRMGFDKKQLKNIFPHSMDFSRFQIEQVQRRNFYTQKLMDVIGMNNENSTPRRIASDKDKSYALVKNSGGWTLALEENGASADKPVEIDEKIAGNEHVEEESISEEEVNDHENAGKSEADEGGTQEDEEDIQWDEISFSNEETPEEKEELKKFIEKIYSKMEPDTETNSNSNSESALRQAVENSKKDLFELQSKENMMKNEALISWDGTGNAHLNEEKQTTKNHFSKEKGLPHLFLGDSFLFGKATPLDNKVGDYKNHIGQKGIEKEENKTLLGTQSNRKKNASQEAMGGNTEGGKFELGDDNFSEVEAQGSHALRTDTLANRNGSEAQKLQQNFNDSDTDNLGNNNSRSFEETSKPLPVWFLERENEDVSLSTAEKAGSPTPEVNLGEVEGDDERAGLIPWSDAKSIIAENVENAEEEHEHEGHIKSASNESDSDVEKTGIETADKFGEEVLRTPRLPTDSTKDNAEKKPDKAAEDEKFRNQRKDYVLDYEFVDEDINMAQEMQTEENEHEILKNKIKTDYEIPLLNMSTIISNEQLLDEKYQKAKRDSDEVTDTMIRDVQELLKRFGIPYITAPMEAEAQCAELLKLRLVDGIITDDSDCFLFGAEKVYKNMFNQKQYVECYLSTDIQSKLGLSLNNLIDLALLLGSDYTEGISGIGPVLGMEILAEFGSLAEFKKWFDKCARQVYVEDENFMSSVKKNLLSRIKNGKLFLPDSFPDKVIYNAYYRPQVDDDTTDFKWGVPNLNGIRSFLMYNLSWSQGRVDEVMVPLIRDMNRRRAEGTQSTIGEFFPSEYIQSSKELKLGKRMKSASSKLSKRARK